MTLQNMTVAFDSLSAAWKTFHVVWDQPAQRVQLVFFVLRMITHKRQSRAAEKASPTPAGQKSTPVHSHIEDVNL